LCKPTLLLPVSAVKFTELLFDDLGKALHHRHKYVFVFAGRDSLERDKENLKKKDNEYNQTRRA